jgi:hypothetical protein
MVYRISPALFQVPAAMGNAIKTRKNIQSIREWQETQTFLLSLQPNFI